MRIPFACDFCGQVVTTAGRINYSEICDNCRHPHKSRPVLVPVKAPVTRIAWKAAS